MLLPDTHEYLGIITGQKRSSVTTILAEEGFIEKRFYRDGFSEHGTQIHRLLHAFDKGLKFKAPDLYMRYLPPYQALLKHLGAEVIDSEVEGEEPVLGYAGCLDKLWHVPGHGVGLVDIKVSQCGYIPAHEYQTEGYRQMLLWHPVYKSLKIDWRGGIIFGPDCEMPRLIPHDRIIGIEKIWPAIVICNAAKHRHKVRMEEINKENGWYI